MVVSSRLLETTASLSGVDEREAAGAVGRLQHAGLEAGLADDGRLLVAGDTEDRDCRAEMALFRDAELGGAILDLGQERRGHAQDVEQPLVPPAVMDIEQQRARGVGRVGDVSLAAGQAPDQKAVDRAEAEIAALGGAARAFDVVEQPGELGAREIRVEHEPGARRDDRLMAGLAQRLAELPPCAGPARRWRGGSACRSCGPR